MPTDTTTLRRPATGIADPLGLSQMHISRLSTRSGAPMRGEVTGGHPRSPSVKGHRNTVGDRRPDDRRAYERTAGTTPDPQTHQAQGAAPC